METEDIVYEIDPSKKYLLTFPAVLSGQAREQIQNRIREWLQSEDPFFIVPPGVKLVKVELSELWEESHHHEKRHLVVAPNYGAARIFAADRGWKRKDWKYAGDPVLLRGLSGWVVYFLPGYWLNPQFTEIEDLLDLAFATHHIEESPEYSRSKAWQS
jgi:hypothetical protein